MLLDEVRRDVISKTGEQAGRINILSVAWNPELFQGGVFVNVWAKYPKLTVPVTLSMLGITTSRTTDLYWRRYRSNNPSLFLIEKQRARGCHRVVSELRYQLGQYSVHTNLGPIAGAFIPFSAYARFREASGQSVRRFDEVMSATAINCEAWFELSVPHHREWAREAMHCTAEEAQDRFIDRLRGELPTERSIRQSAELNYSATYLVQSGETDTPTSIVQRFERDCVGKLMTLISRDILDPLANVTAGKPITDHRRKRVAELVERVRMLNFVDNAEVNAMIQQVNELVKRKDEISQSTFDQNIANLARICAEDLASMNLTAPTLSNITLDDDGDLELARKELGIPNLISQINWGEDE